MEKKDISSFGTKKSAGKTLELVFIQDKSGSMSGLVLDTIGGYNSFLAEQKEIPGSVAFSLIQFDDKYEVVHDRAALYAVPSLTNDTYRPRGSTALYDAIGKTIMSLGSRAIKADKTIVIIQTDGQENSSREFTQASIKELITAKEAMGWEFIYLAANQDAFLVGGNLGLKGSNISNYVPSGVGTAKAFYDTSSLVGAYREDAFYVSRAATANYGKADMGKSTESIGDLSGIDLSKVKDKTDTPVV